MAASAFPFYGRPHAPNYGGIGELPWLLAGTRKAAAPAAHVKSDGYRYQKWFLEYELGDGQEGMKKNVDLVRVMREVVGGATELMFDVYSGWDLTYALAWAKQVEHYRPRWIEKATQAEKIGSFAELRRGMSIPIASGEHIQGRWRTLEDLGYRVFVRCARDPSWAQPSRALHMIASQSRSVCPLAEYLILKIRSYYHFEQRPPVPKNGHFSLSDGPGYNIEFDESKIESRRHFEAAKCLLRISQHFLSMRARNNRIDLGLE